MPAWWDNWVRNLFPRLADELRDGLDGAPDWVPYVIIALLASLIVVNLPALLTPIFIFVERRFLGRLQHRIGPNRVGPFGLLQPVADAIKLMTKEDIVPERADKLVFNLAPLLAAIPIFAVFAVIPYSFRASLADLNIGILYVVAVTSVTEVAVFAAGWSSNNKYALFGAARAVAMLISYEIPLALSIVPIVLMVGSLQMSDIVDAQRWVPFLVINPLAFLIMLTAVSAELNRTPFDLLEAESELTTGYHVEYSGMKWGVFMLAEYAGAFAYSAVITTLFLSGWRSPFLPGFVWFGLKVAILWLVFIWIRGTFPRLRVDQVTSLAWKFLFPLALVNILVTAIEVLVAQEFDLTRQVVAHGGTAYEKTVTLFPEWFALINIPLTVLLIVAAARIFGFPGKTRQVVPTPATVAPAQQPIGAKGG